MRNRDPKRVSATRAKAVAIARARSHGDAEGEHRARRDLAAHKIENYVEETLAVAPPLTSEQRDRIALALRGSNR